MLMRGNLFNGKELSFFCDSIDRLQVANVVVVAVVVVVDGGSVGGLPQALAVPCAAAATA